MIECKSAGRQITVEIPSVGLEIAPFNVDFRRSRGELDYFKGNFHSEVGDHMESEVFGSGGKLTGVRKALVKMEGDRVYPMVWRPDGFRNQRDICSIELYDPRVQLEYGSTNLDNRMEARNALSEVFTSSVEALGSEEVVIDGIEFIHEMTKEEIPVQEDVNAQRPNTWGSGGSGVQTGNSLGDIVLAPANSQNLVSAVEPIGQALPMDTVIERESDVDNLKEVFETHLNFEFEDASPLEIFDYVSEQLNIDFWVIPDPQDPETVTLYVGKYVAFQKLHIGAGEGVVEDTPVFQIGDFTVRDAYKPIKRVEIRGNVVDVDSQTETIDGAVDKHNTETELHNSVAYGICEREDLDFGRIIADEAPEVESGPQLAKIARSRMRDEMSSQRSGNMEIIPQLSGKPELDGGVSDYRFMDVGDIIHTAVPQGDRCSNFSNIREEDYHIRSVDHSISDNGWYIDLDIHQRIPEEDVPEGKYKIWSTKTEELKDPE